MYWKLMPALKVAKKKQIYNRVSDMPKTKNVPKRIGLETFM